MISGYLRISTIYILISLLWVTLSDKLLFLFRGNLNASTILLISSCKGYIFVLVTGVLIYKLIKADDERLRDSEKQYRSMYEGNPLPMWIYDLDTLRFTSVNEAAIKKYGYTREQFQKMTILDIRPTADIASVKKSVQSVSKHFKQSGKWMHTRADGSQIHVVITSQRIVFNKKPHVMVIAQDVTDKAIFEQQLEKLNNDLTREKRKLSATQQMAKVAGWELYLKNKELVWSDEMFIITGISKDTKQNLFDVYVEHIFPDDRQSMIDGLEQLISTGKEMDVTHRVTFTDGEVHYIRQVARLEYKHNHPYKVYGSMQDITELKLLELEKNRYLVSLDATLNNMNEGFYALNKEMVITQANKHFELETGMSNAYTIGKKFTDVFPGIQERVTYHEFVKVLQDRVTAKFEAYSRRMKKWIFVTAYPTEEGLAAYFNDITELKEKDLKLKRAIELYEHVSKATQDIIYDYDLQADKLVYSNSLQQFMNYTPEQIGYNFQWLQSIIHFDDQKAFITSQQKAIDNKQTNWSCEYRMDCGHGNYKYVYDQGYFIYNDEGEPVRLIGAIKDIDALKRSDEENKRLAEIITKVNNMVVVMDTNSRITWSNKAFQDYAGRSAEDILGKTPGSFLLRKKGSEQIVAHINECKRQLQTFSVELAHYIKGREHWVHIEYTPLFDQHGKHTGYIAVHQDITARKQEEERVKRQNKALQEIAWLSSHEVRRPVASIMGLANLAADAGSVKEKEEILQLINQCAKELDCIVHDITQRVHQEANSA